MNQTIYKERNDLPEKQAQLNGSDLEGIKQKAAAHSAHMGHKGEINLGSQFSKNWRLVQLMTLLESNMQPNLKTSRARSVNLLRNEVKYKNIYIQNPILGIAVPLARSDSDKLKRLDNIVDLKNDSCLLGLPEGPDTKSTSYAPKVCVSASQLQRAVFPIKAKFVAQWLSENIVSSKTYKLSVLCDRVIKASRVGEAFLNRFTSPYCSSYVTTLVGIKIIISGRILGAEIATSKTFKAGQIPNNTITILKDSGFALAKTRSGTIGVKVIYFWSKP